MIRIEDGPNYNYIFLRSDETSAQIAIHKQTSQVECCCLCPGNGCGIASANGHNLPRKECLEFYSEMICLLTL